MSNTQFEDDIVVKTKTTKPSFYKVFLMNDDFTPMDFVVDVLMAIFDKSQDQAEIIMMQVHHEGQALCGMYSYEIAEMKVSQVEQLAKSEQHPLQCFLERDA